MNDKERHELAADIAARVRLLCVQSVPKSFMDRFHDTLWRYPLNGSKINTDYGYINIEFRHGAMHFEVWLNDNKVLHLRLDEDPSR